MTDVRSPDEALDGAIEVRVPADPSMSRVLRLAASGVASLRGFSVDEIEDIKIAISEVLIALIEHGGGRPVDIRLTADDGTFTISGATAVTSFDIEHPDLRLCRTVLAGVCAEHSIELVDHEARISAAIRRPWPAD